MLDPEGEAIYWTLQPWDPAAAVGEYVRVRGEGWSYWEAKGYTVKSVCLAEVVV